MAAAKSAKPDRRKQLYKLLQVGKRELGLDESTYRDLLLRHGAKVDIKGKASASSMRIDQLDAVLKSMQASGFKIKSKAKTKVDYPTKGTREEGKTDWRSPRLNMVWSLWQQLADSDHPKSVRNGSDRALLWWCQQQSNVDRPEWLTTYQINRLVEALKAWCKRCDITILPEGTWTESTQ